MLMVIFGAGASYDSHQAIPPQFPQYRLPLANQLFDRRFGDDYNAFPQCHAIIPLLQKPNVNVESVLERLQREAADYSPGYIQLAAVRYYLQLMLWRCQTTWTRDVTKGPTNYKTLLDQIARRPIGKGEVVLVTFNYDTLLDEALTSRGIKLDAVNDYIGPRNDFHLIKLHGSTNWAHPVNDFPVRDNEISQQQLIGRIIDRADGIDIAGDQFEIVPANPFGRPLKPYYPAISIPVENKQGYECPSNQVAALKGNLHRVQKILVIGWRASEKKFLETLGEKIPSDAQMMVVSSDEQSAMKTIETIKASVQISNYHAAKGGFSQFIDSPEADDFLRI